MAIADLTIDTNVIAHSDNEIEKRQEFSLKFLLFILASSEKLCLDYQKNRDFNINSSIIWKEYEDIIPSQSFGKKFLQKMLNEKRISPTLRSVNQRERNIINQRISNAKSNDKTFLKTSFNSKSKIFISHDYQDFQQPKRNFFNEKLEVLIIEASDFLENNTEV